MKIHATRKELALLAQQIRRWSAGALQALHGQHAAAEAERMRTAVTRLEYWSSSLAEARGESEALCQGHRWRYTSECLLDSIRLALKLKGGASQLEHVLLKAIKLVAPDILVGALERRLSTPGAVAGSSTVRFHELTLDLALVEMRIRNYSADAIRFLWSDSSQQLGYDLLWAQYHEIQREQLVPTFKAFNVSGNT